MLVVGPNLTFDRRVFLPTLTLGTVSRSRRTEALPGGKPVNVIRAARAHQISATLVALIPRRYGATLVQALADEGITPVEVAVDGAVRDVVVLYEDSGRSTVINSPGSPIETSDWNRLLVAVDELAARHQVMVCSGSLPPGAPEDSFSSLIALARRNHCEILLDAGPAWLGRALAEQPDLVSPNLLEAEAVLSGHVTDEAIDVVEEAPRRALEAAAGLVRHGARAAVVSAGAAGAALCDGNRTTFIDAVPVDVVNPIGAGDALLGGLAAQREAGLDWYDALLWGMASAGSAISQWLPGAASAEQTQRLHERLTKTALAPEALR